MAPMLLPFWTDGCIGSMEGLYFEASSTTPYHFLNQRALSANCSCAQRDLPVRRPASTSTSASQQLQHDGRALLLRVHRHWPSTAADDASRPHRGRHVRRPWHAYLVADSDLVAPLAQRAGRDDRARAGHVVGRAGARSGRRTRPAGTSPSPTTAPTSGSACRSCTRRAGQAGRRRRPADAPTWTRLDVCTTPDGAAAARRSRVSDDRGRRRRHQLRRVRARRAGAREGVVLPELGGDRRRGPVPGHPNLMVVIPTDTHVELHYGWTGVDLGAYGLSLLGVVGVVVPRPPPDAPTADGRVWLDGPDPVVAAGRPRRSATPTTTATTTTTDDDGRSTTPRPTTDEAGEPQPLARFAVVGTAVTAVDVGLFVAPLRGDGAPLGRRRRGARPRRRRRRVVGAAPRRHLPRRPVPALAVRSTRPSPRRPSSPAPSTAPSPPRCSAVAGRATRGPRWPRSSPPSPSPAPSAGRCTGGCCSGSCGPTTSPDPDREPAPGELRLSVVIPAFEEAGRIGATVRRVRAALAGGRRRRRDRRRRRRLGRRHRRRGQGGRRRRRRRAARRTGARAPPCGPGCWPRRGRTIAFTDADLAY